MTDEPLWKPRPQEVAATEIVAFMEEVNRQHGLSLASYSDLHAWSIDHSEKFWSLVWDRSGVIGHKGSRLVADADQMPGARFLPDARLNFAENLLHRSDDGEALVFRGEDKAGSRMSWRELAALVSRLQQALAASGVGVGDRVAAMLPNMPQAIASTLAAASIGAVWSSCSPDFGERGVLDRFGQIEPKLFIAVDGYWYNGRPNRLVERLEAIIPKLPTAAHVVIVDYLGEAESLAKRLPRAVTFAEFIKPFAAAPLRFERLPFAHPVFILFSSGTTGVPKGIVHCAGGVLLKIGVEHRLHTDLKRGDRVFYFTTCGWMMWNWLVTGLATGATLVLYDGSPFQPGERVLWDLAERERITIFGTSAKYLDALRKSELEPRRSHDLSALRTILSTGSVLAPESFDFVYAGIKRDVLLSSISGGTDIAGCFAAGSPTLPVWRGEAQCLALGMKVEVFDESGRSLPPGEKGELVCTAAFPSLPVGFWNDPDGARYRAAYFERYPGAWHHGDWVERTEHGGMTLYGRSDAVLNPGGVRIGTAEIYRPVEQLDEVVEAIAVGQDWEGDVRVVLFVRLREGVTLSPEPEGRIKAAIRAHATPRHVPARVVQVADIPRTKSGKIVELAVRDVVHGRTPKNLEALANPEALEQFRDRDELES